jgi:tape measure domain-containing protein
MEDNTGLNAEVGITLGRLTQQLAKAEARMIKTAKRGEDAFNKSTLKSAGSFRRIDTAVQRTSLGIGRMGGVLAGALSVREIQRYADAWTLANNKVAAASEIAGVQARSLSDINDIATATRSGIAETADLYAKLLRATAGVAKSEEDVARATELVNKAFKAGGAAASEQAAGIMQLAQGLSSGILQGDELRSIRENAPVVAQAIADEFGVTIGKLKDLGSEGALTSDRVFQAILKAQPKIEAAFSKTTATIGENFTLLRNAMTEYIALGDSSIGATEKIGVAMKLLADNLTLVSVGLGFVVTRGLSAATVAMLSRFAPAITAARASLAGLSAGASVTAVSLGVLRGALALVGGPIGLGIIAASGAAYAFSQIKDSAETFDETSTRLSGTLAGLGAVNGNLLEDYAALKTAQDALKSAIDAGGQAAIDAAALDVQAVQSRIEASAALRRERAILAQIELADLEASLAAQEAAFIEGARQRLIADDEYARQLARQKMAQGTISEGVTDSDVRTFIAGEIEKSRAAALTGEAVSETTRYILETSVAIRESAAEFETASDNVNVLVGDAEKLKSPLDDAAVSTADIVAAAGLIDFSDPISGAVELARLLGIAAANAAAVSNAKVPTEDPLDAFGGAGDWKYDQPSTFKPPKPKKPKTSGGGSRSRGRKEEPFFEDAQRQVDALNLQISLIGKTVLQKAKLTAQEKLLAEAKRRGLDLDARQAETGETLREQIDRQADSIGRLTEKYEAAREQGDFWDQQLDSMKGGLIDAIVEGESLEGVLGNVAKAIAKAALQAALFNEGPLRGLFSGGGGGLFGSGGGGFFKGLLGFEGGGYTGRGARTGGVDGRGGFPAILHPNETVVDHTKKGSGSAAQVAVRVIGGDLTVSDNGEVMAQVRVVADNSTAAGLKRVPEIMSNHNKRMG